MKKNMRSWLKALAVLLASVALGVAGRAEIVYDNSTNYLGDFFAASGEFGDQIQLAPIFSDPTVIEFKFDYFLSHGANGNETAQLKFYDMEGPDVSPEFPIPTPGNLLYDSGVAPLTTRGFGTFTAAGLSVMVPDEFAWTVTFTGIEGTEQVGLLFYDPPTIGSSLDDYWDKTGGTWALKQFTPGGGAVANFGARVTAVPEPATIQYAFMAGLGWVGMMIYRRRLAKHS